MVHQLIPMLPQQQGNFALAVTIGAAVLGVLLWALGARFSRQFVTLLMVTIGSIVGGAMPEWFGWPIHPMATAVGFGVLLGALGWGLHRLWIGIGLGLVLSLWAAIGTWLHFSGGMPWAYPQAEGLTLVQLAREVWNTLPEDVKQFLPFACSAAMLSAIGTAVMWPRVATVMMYSSAGASLAAAMTLIAIQSNHPNWVSRIPPQMWAQITLLVCVVLFGAILQWQLSPRRGIPRSVSPRGR